MHFSQLSRIKTLISIIFKSDKLYGPKSYAQNGEDLILSKILTGQKGFYVDIGAHHPFRYSNTYLLYKRGWDGINIEPTPGSKRLFDRLRNRDVNLELAVGKKDKKKFYVFCDSALNTFSKKRANEVILSGQSKLRTTLTLQITPIEKLFNEHIPNKKIDLLNIDAEGMELEILKTNDWKRFKPTIVVVENIGNNSNINKFLSFKGYNLIKKTALTEIYKLYD
jgi:FkbM family methyltransferase